MEEVGEECYEHTNRTEPGSLVDGDCSIPY